MYSAIPAHRLEAIVVNLLNNTSRSKKNTKEDLKISLIIKTQNWGSARANEVLKILNAAHKTMSTAFDRSFPGNIFIYQEISDESPITLYERAPCGAYKIKLSATDYYWCQYIYQFSHEYCHVRTNYSIFNQRRKWFEESVCELASLYALKKMSASWKTKPPFPHLKDFSESLTDYVSDIMLDPDHQLPEGVNFRDWFKANIRTLERDQYIRNSNTLIALKLLPLFEEHPSLWNSMTYWNTWNNKKDDDIFSCFQSWVLTLPLGNRKGAMAVTEIFNNVTEN